MTQQAVPVASQKGRSWRIGYLRRCPNSRVLERTVRSLPDTREVPIGLR